MPTAALPASNALQWLGGRCGSGATPQTGRRHESTGRAAGGAGVPRTLPREDGAELNHEVEPSSCWRGCSPLGGGPAEAEAPRQKRVHWAATDRLLCGRLGGADRTPCTTSQAPSEWPRDARGSREWTDKCPPLQRTSAGLLTGPDLGLLFTSPPAAKTVPPLTLLTGIFSLNPTLQRFPQKPSQKACLTPHLGSRSF